MPVIDMALPFAVCQPQLDFYLDDETPYPAYVSGYGGGKTYVGLWKAIRFCLLNKGYPGIVVAPTFPMIKKIMWPLLFDGILNPLRVPYHLHKNDFTLDFRWGSRIWFYSAERPERIVGTNVAWAYLDEAGLMPEIVWKNTVSRVRVNEAAHRQIFATFTPENPGWTHERWGRGELYGEPLQEGFKVYRGSTADNWKLPPDFMENMLSQWGEEEAQARIYGKFSVSRTGKAYYAFGNENIRDVDYDPAKELWFSFDFNSPPVGMHVVVYQGTAGDHRFIDEIHSPKFTLEDAIIECLRRYGNHRQGVVVTGDSTGTASASATGYYKIIMDYFEGNAKVGGFLSPIRKMIKRNPPVTDRVANFNRLLRDSLGVRRISISPKCKQLRKDLDTLLTVMAKAVNAGKAYVGSDANHPDKTDLTLTHASDAAGYVLWLQDPLQTKFQRFQSIRPNQSY